MKRKHKTMHEAIAVHVAKMQRRSEYLDRRRPIEVGERVVYTDNGHTVARPTVYTVKAFHYVTRQGVQVKVLTLDSGFRYPVSEDSCDQRWSIPAVKYRTGSFVKRTARRLPRLTTPS